MNADYADLERQPGWTERLCTNTDYDLFFPRPDEPGPDAVDRLTPTARTYCAHCPVQEACGEFGAQFGYGLWGGQLYRGNKTPVNLLTLEGTS